MPKKELCKNYQEKSLESLGWNYFWGLQELDTESSSGLLPFVYPASLIRCLTPSCNPPLSISKFVPSIYWIN